METLEQIKLDSILAKIQTCIIPEESKMKLFFDECFEDLINRIEIEEVNKKLEKITFNRYLNLPVVVSDKIFNAFNESRSGYLNKQEFTDGMYDLYCSGSLERLEKITFKIFNFNSNGKIIKEDVMIVLTYISCSERIFNILETAILDFFGEFTEINYEEYVHIIENKNSNIFLILLIYLYQSEPFTEDAIKFFEKHTKKQIKQEKSKFSNNKEKNMICDPKNEIPKLFKYILNISECKVSRKRSSKNLLNFHEELKIEIEEIKSEDNNDILFYDNIDENNIENLKFNLGSLNIINNIENNSSNCVVSRRNSSISNKSSCKNSLVKVPSTFSKAVSSGSSIKSFSSLSGTESKDSDSSAPCNNNKYHNKLSSFSQYVSTVTTSDNENSDEINKSSIEQIVYKVKNDGKITKFKLVAIDSTLFSFQYSSSKNEFSLTKIHPLNGYFFAKCEETVLSNKILYPLALLNKWGNSIANLRNIFFCKSLRERDEFTDKLRSLMKIKEFKDYYEIVSEIGKGQFGKVKLATCKKTQQKVAIKVIDKTKLKPKEYEIVRAEIDLIKFLMNFDHPNIVKTIDVLEDNKHIYMVLEYMEGGSLHSYLISQGNLIPENIIKVIARQILEGLLFLGSVGIMHRDLKPENILISIKERDNIQVKITDFGLSKVLGKNEKTSESFGTLVYSAPEIILKKKYCNKIDTWSFGVILYYMMTGILPFDGKGLTSEEIAKKICFDPISFPENLPLSIEVKKLIKCCLNKNSVERYSFDQIKGSEWMTL